MNFVKRNSAISVRALRGAMALLATCFVALSGCSRQLERVAMPPIDAQAAGQEALIQYDTDGDGKISGKELDRVPSLKHALTSIDTNGDSALSAEEITARIEIWQASKVARITGVPCRVTHGGKPLPQATVTLEPEKFLGDSVPSATGISNLRGRVLLSAPVQGPDDIPGIAPGFYLVRITKGGLDIPAKYNSHSVLGREVSQKAAVVSEGMRFDVQ